MLDVEVVGGVTKTHGLNTAGHMEVTAKREHPREHSKVVGGQTVFLNVVRAEEAIREGGAQAVPQRLFGDVGGIVNRLEKAVHGGVRSGTMAGDALPGQEVAGAFKVRAGEQFLEGSDDSESTSVLHEERLVRLDGSNLGMDGMNLAGFLSNQGGRGSWSGLWKSWRRKDFR